MFKAGVPEKIIQQQTAYLSTKGLRVYERKTIEQQQAVCDILQSSEATSSYYGNNFQPFVDTIKPSRVVQIH